MQKDVIISRIFQTVEDVTGINKVTILSRSRDRDCHFARMIVAHHLRMFGFRYGHIGEIIGQRSESHTAYLLRAYQKEQTPYFRACAEKVKRTLKDNAANS